MGDPGKHTRRGGLVVPRPIVVQGNRELRAAPSLINSEASDNVRNLEAGIVKRTIGRSAGSQNREEGRAERTANCARRAGLLEVSDRMGEECVVLNRNARH